MTNLHAAAFVLVLASAGAGAAVACGGAAETGLFGVDSTSSGSTEDAGVDARAEAAGHGDATTDGGARDTSTSPPDTARDDATPLPVDATPDVAPVPDPGVRCGADECKVPVDECCRSGAAGFETFACTAQGSGVCTLPDDLQVPCDDARDCTALGRPGTVCCAQEGFSPVTQMLTVTSVSCRSPGSCTGNRKIVCDTTPGGCPPGTLCAAAATFPGFNLCQ